MSKGPEYDKVERPLVDQLASMGWTWTEGDIDSPAVTLRENFRDVFLLDDLKTALVRLNLNDKGKEWLDEGRLGQAFSALQRHGARNLIEANQTVTELLLKGTVVEGYRLRVCKKQKASDVTFHCSERKPGWSRAEGESP